MSPVLSFLVAVFAGWPAILTAMLLAGIGLFKTNYRLLVAAALVAFLPFWVLSGFPIVGSPVFLIPLLLFSAAFAMFRGHEMLAWILGIPFFLVIFLLVSAVLAG